MIGTQFEWDDARSDTCFARRGFDFAHAVRAFLDPHRVFAQDRRQDCGEERCQLIGLIDGRAYVVVHTNRRLAIRIISARKTDAREVVDYEHNARQD